MTIELKIIVLAIITTVLIVLSRRSLKDIHHYGIYRLATWVSSIALVLLNIEYWFTDPFSLYQIISWILLIISIIMVCCGFYSLRGGRINSSRKDDSLFNIEKTTSLVTTGAFRYIRHPIYSSLVFGALGVMFKNLTWLGAVLAGLTILFAFITSKIEEKINIRYFGEPYLLYIKKTRRFIPFIF